MRERDTLCEAVVSLRNGDVLVLGKQRTSSKSKDTANDRLVPTCLY